MTDIGHNVAITRLGSIVDRIERLEEERKTLGADIRDIYTEAKSAGFDVKALRQLIRERREGQEAREERQELVELYRAALGQLADTALGAAAMERVSA